MNDELSENIHDENILIGKFILSCVGVKFAFIAYRIVSAMTLSGFSVCDEKSCCLFVWKIA